MYHKNQIKTNIIKKIPQSICHEMKFNRSLKDNTTEKENSGFAKKHLQQVTKLK